MKKLFVLFIVFVIFLSCEPNIREKDTYEIVSLITQEYGLPLPPPPPPPPARLPSLKEMGWDSIKKLEQNIAVYPVLKNTKKLFSKYPNEEDVEFRVLIEKMNKDKNDSTLDISKLNVNEQFQLSIVDTSLLKKDKYHIEKNYDKLLIFHNISFNTELNKAVTLIGVSMAPLNGFSSLVFLEKKKGKWVIVKSKELTIS